MEHLILICSKIDYRYIHIHDLFLLFRVRLFIFMVCLLVFMVLKNVPDLPKNHSTFSRRTIHSGLWNPGFAFR